MRLDGVQAHGVHEPVGEISEEVHEEHGPKPGIGDGVQFAAGGHDFEKR
jgi:hypothetical protein